MIKNCIETQNHEKTKVIFTEKQRQQKSLKHPELRETQFIKRVIIAIEKPDFIYEDLAKKSRMVYYKYEYSLNGRTKYTKLILEKKKNYFFVITAFRPDYIKERGKTKLLYGKDND